MDVNALLRLFADQTPQHAMILFDVDARIIWWNPKTTSLFGYPMEDAIGRTPEFLFVPEDVERGIPRYEFETADARVTSEDDRWMLRADGTRFWAFGSLIRLEDERGEPAGYCKVLKDRTDVKEQLEMLRNNAELLVQTDAQRNNFIGTLGHEVRNTLAPIANALEIIRLRTESIAEVVFSLKLIGRQVDFIGRLVDDLLDVTRMQTGKIALIMESVDLRDVVDQAAHAAMPTAQSKSQRLNVVLLGSPVPVLCDKDRLHQVFVNLLNNASKFTPEGGRITVDMNIEGKEAVVKVTDTGSGIATGDLARIFDLFTQAENSRHTHGLGIGLALVREFVALHHGSVQARSDGPGKGSQFIVRLPLHDAAR